MAKCIRCGGEAFYNSRICSSCLGKWTDMRLAVFTELEKKHGKLTSLNHELYKKEIKRLEKIWRKDRDKFSIELEAISK